jgi:hypothetical protein
MRQLTMAGLKRELLLPLWQLAALKWCAALARSAMMATRLVCQ